MSELDSFRRRAHEAVGTCNCWVANESEEVRFGIHFGAHCSDCPQFRVSGDPVDRANDEELRERECRIPEHQTAPIGFAGDWHNQRS